MEAGKFDTFINSKNRSVIKNYPRVSSFECMDNEVFNMGLSTREKQVITSPRILSPANKSLYKHRLRKRIDEIVRDIAFLYEHKDELDRLGIDLDDKLQVLRLGIKLEDHTNTQKIVDKPQSNTNVTANDEPNSVQASDTLTKSYLLD